MRAVVSVSASTLVLTCLLITSGARVGATESPTLPGTAWTLAALPAHALLPDPPVTLRFEDERVYGSDGCNRYSAPYETSSGGFHLSAPVSSTKMSCPDPVMKQAGAFLAALANARGARIEGARLALIGADGTVVASFDPQREALAGTEWQVTGYNTGAQAVVSVLAGTDLSIRFSGDGNVSGSAGCNDFAGTYTSSGQSLTIRADAATRNMCQQPDGVMKQERIFLETLAGVALVRMEGDRLELRARNGALLVRAARTDGTRGPGGA